MSQDVLVKSRQGMWEIHPEVEEAKDQEKVEGLHVDLPGTTDVQPQKTDPMACVRKLTKSVTGLTAPPAPKKFRKPKLVVRPQRMFD